MRRRKYFFRLRFRRAANQNISKRLEDPVSAVLDPWHCGTDPLIRTTNLRIWIRSFHWWLARYQQKNRFFKVTKHLSSRIPVSDQEKVSASTGYGSGSTALYIRQLFVRRLVVIQQNRKYLVFSLKIVVKCKIFACPRYKGQSTSLETLIPGLYKSCSAYLRLLSCSYQKLIRQCRLLKVPWYCSARRIRLQLGSFYRLSLKREARSFFRKNRPSPILWEPLKL